MNKLLLILFLFSSISFQSFAENSSEALCPLKIEVQMSKDISSEFKSIIGILKSKGYYPELKTHEEYVSLLIDRKNADQLYLRIMTAQELVLGESRETSASSELFSFSNGFDKPISLSVGRDKVNAEGDENIGRRLTSDFKKAIVNSVNQIPPCVEISSKRNY